MKRVITGIAIMTLCSLMLYANPFKGTWEVELVFTDVPLIFRFIDGETLSVQRFGDQSEEFGGYILDIQNRIIDLGKISGMELKTRYHFVTEDFFTLYFTEDIREQMASEMSISVPPDANQITKDFAQAFLDAIQDMLTNTPIVAGRRIQ
jgi:hypothetical protein